MNKIIVGLGNPGAKYLKTRHNVGFMFIDYLAKNFGAERFEEKAKFKAVVQEIELMGTRILLVKPQTFMNNSGETLLAIKQFYDFAIDDFLVVYDDIDLPFGAIRLREQGSAGTHNGMRSVISLLHTEAIPRLRIGVESRPEELKDKWPLDKFVLSDFTEEEEKSLYSEVFVKAEAELKLLLSS